MTTNNWRDELKGMGTEVHQGELRNAIYGVLHDPDKLESFVEKQREEAKEEVRKEILDWADKRKKTRKYVKDDGKVTLVVQNTRYQQALNDLVDLLSPHF